MRVRSVMWFLVLAALAVTVVMLAIVAVMSDSGISTETAYSQSCLSPPAGLVSWWPGDGDPTDIMGVHDGVLENGAGFAPGKVGQAFVFDGVDDFVSVPDDPIWTLGDHPFTVDVWVNFDQLKGRDPFVSHDEAGGQFNKWIFWFDAQGHDKPPGSALRFHINSPTLPPLDPVFYPWTPNLGQWYHVAVTRAGNTYALYIDGAQVATGTDPNVIPDPDAPVMIGRAEGYFFDGRIDEVEIYSRALAPGEIQAIYNAGSAGKCKPLAPTPTPTPSPTRTPTPVATPPPGVGGAVRLPPAAIAAESGAQAEGSGWPVGAYAALGGMVVVIAVGGWYARRRWLR